MGDYEDTLTRLGFVKDPFQHQFDEKILEETWVAFPGAEKILDLEQSSVFLAPPGSGKTTWRRYIEKIIARESEEKYLAVIYNRFQLPSNSIVTLNDHRDPLLRQIARTVYNHLQNIQNQQVPSDIFPVATKIETIYRHLWCAFLSNYLPKYYKQNIADLFLLDIERNQNFADWGNLDDLREILLDELLPALSALGFNRLYLLLDDLDGLPETQEHETLSAFVNPLINTSLLFSDARLVWKFFIPVRQEDWIRQSSGYKSGRIELFSIRWDMQSLSKLLELRLIYASEGNVQDIEKFFEEAVLNKGLPSIAMSRIALILERLGPPRTLLQHGRLLFENISGAVITKEDWDNFLEQVWNAFRTDTGDYSMSKEINRIELKRILQSRFSLLELREVCFDLGITYDDLIGSTQTEKVMAFIEYLQRYDRFPDFLVYSQTHRPEIDWTTIIVPTKEDKVKAQATPLTPQETNSTIYNNALKPHPVTLPSEPEYLDFELHIMSDGHAITKSFEGERSTKIITSIPNNVELSLKLIENNQTGEFIKDLGKLLYDIILLREIDTHLNQSEAVARRQHKNLRIRLTIEPDTLARIPWEFIYRNEGGYFLSNNPKTVFSRYINLPLPPDRVKKDQDTPLHMLVIVSDPIDQVRLDPDEWEEIILKALSKPLQENQLTVHTVKHATRKEIQRALLEQPPDIIQFVGHGVYNDKRGFIALVSEDAGDSWIVDDETFANLFMGHDDRLGLVSLATCESAKSDSPQGFIGIAPKIVQRGVPAVVAMQYPVLIKTAKIFLETFYTAVAQRKPIDWAVQHGRNTIGLEMGYDNREFATPVLYMRAKDGKVF